MAFMSAAACAGFERGAPFEVDAGYGIQLEGKRRALQPRERVGNVIDGVVRHGQGTVAARVGGGEPEVGVEFLIGLDIHIHGLALHGGDSAGVGVEHIRGVDQIAMVLQQPVHAVRFAAFLVGGEGEDQVAVGAVVFTVEADEVGDQDGVVHLHVLGAAAIEVAVFLDELEGVGGPVGAAGFDDVQVADESEWACARRCRAAWPPGCLCGCWGPAPARRRGEAGIEQALGHGVGGLGGAAHRIGGVDFDQLLEDVARQARGWPHRARPRPEREAAPGKREPRAYAGWEGSCALRLTWVC